MTKAQLYEEIEDIVAGPESDIELMFGVYYDMEIEAVKNALRWVQRKLKS